MTEAFVQSGRARLWTAAQGSGIPLLLCNGGPGCCDYLVPVAAMLDDLAYVIRFEARGCGRSDPAPSYDISGAVRDLEAIREHYDIEHWVVGGHSWGPDLALAYALEHPDRVLGLVGIAGGKVVNDRSWHEAYVYGRDHIGEATPEQAYPFNDEVNRQLNASWRAYIQSPSLFRRLAELEVPALFVYGGKDIRPSWPTEQLAELLPQGRFERIDGAAHLVWATHTEELRGRLRAFMRELAAGGW
jgi:proline iminopeptidase